MKLKEHKFVNSKTMKNSIKIGEPVFVKDVRYDQIRAGYT